MSQRLGIGIIGLGSIGKTHARAVQELTDDLILVGATRTTGDVLRELGAPDAQPYDSTAELLADPQVNIVVVASPSEKHAEHVIAALRAGKHVVAEKPLAVTVDQLEAVEEVAKETGRFVSVIAQRRLEPQHVEIKKLLDEGQLGKILLAEAFVHWHRDDAYYRSAAWRALAPGGGSMMNQALHSVDLLDWLVGPVTAVTGFTATLRHEIEAEDTAVASLRLASGGLGVIVSSTAVTPPEPAVLVLRTTEGTVEITQSDISRWDMDESLKPTVHSAATSGAANPADIGIVGHVAQWQDIVRALRTHSNPAVSLQDGARAVRIIAGLYESSRAGRTIEVS